MRWQTHDQPDDVWHLIHELAEVQTPEEFTEVVNALFEYARLEETGAVIKIPSRDNTSPQDTTRRQERRRRNDGEDDHGYPAHLIGPAG